MATQSIQEQRFWSKVNKSGECWLWTASFRSSGYGHFRFNGKLQSAQRVAWQLTYGPIPQGTGYHGVCVLHRCDVRACVNPNHLFLGTHLDNMADKMIKGRHEDRRGELNPKAKLTKADIIAIRADTRTQIIIAADYGVWQSTIGRIQRREIWAHIIPSPSTAE